MGENLNVRDFTTELPHKGNCSQLALIFPHFLIMSIISNSKLCDNLLTL